MVEASKEQLMLRVSKEGGNARLHLYLSSQTLPGSL
jgi:hypothetical protein